jgi:hypothetical protein
MPTNARTIIRAALTDIGALAQGENVPAADAQEGLRRLNLLVSSWNAQNLTANAITRTVVPIVANQQFYSVGPGAQINIPRPMALANVGLLLAGFGTPVAVTSITSASSVATATVTSHGFTTGQAVYILGATQPQYNGLVSVTVTGVNTFTYPIQGSPVSPATGTITVTEQADAAVEIPRAIYTDAAWQANQVKNLTSTLFTGAYYNPTQPWGTLALWPIPTSSANQLILYTTTQFAAFADLTTDYTFTDMPGYEEALEYNLAVRLSTPFGRELPSAIASLASSSLALIKRGNVRLVDLEVDAALTANRGAWYNIQTGNL